MGRFDVVILLSGAKSSSLVKDGNAWIERVLPRGASPNFARDHLSATWDDSGISSGCRDVDCIWTCTQLIGENDQGCAADALSYPRWA